MERTKGHQESTNFTGSISAATLTGKKMTSLVIDAHSHLYPEPYLRHLESRQAVPRIIRRDDECLFNIFPGEHFDGRPINPAYWVPEAKLEFMDRHGIDRSVISLGNPWLNPIPDAAGDALAREVNQELAALKTDTGGRLVGMGALPSSSPEKAAAELNFIAGQDGLVGVACGPKIAGLHLDDPGLEPFWNKLAGLNRPLFIHPEDGIGVKDFADFSLTLTIGIAFPLETTIAVSRLIFGGILERHPGLRILVAHGGGTLPYLSGRIDAVWQSDALLQENLPKPPSEYLRKLYFDGVVYSQPAMRALASLAGPGHIFFGTDHPFSVADPQANRQAAEDEFGYGADLRSVLGEGAEQFFGL